MVRALEGRRVLVVEDEALVAMMIEAMLEDLGCVVEAVVDRVDQALNLVEGGVAFDVALLDINVAGVLSFPVAQALEARGLPYVFCSGYGAGALPPEWRDRAILQKPYDEADVREALMRALGVSAA